MFCTLIHLILLLSEAITVNISKRVSGGDEHHDGPDDLGVPIEGRM